MHNITNSANEVAQLALHVQDSLVATHHTLTYMTECTQVPKLRDYGLGWVPLYKWLSEIVDCGASSTRNIRVLGSEFQQLRSPLAH